MSRSVLAEMSSWLWSIYYCNYLFHAGSGAGYFRSLFCGDNWIINERLAEISESAKDVSVFWKAPFLQNKNWLRQRAPRITTAYWKPNYNDLYRNTPFSSLRWDNIKKAIIILYIQELTEGAFLSFIARNASVGVVAHSINTCSVVFTWAGITVISIWWEIKNATLSTIESSLIPWHEHPLFEIQYSTMQHFHKLLCCGN